MTRMFLTVAICTFNRAKELSRAVESVLQQDFPKDSYEILIVDNHSTDQTAELGQGLEGAHRGLVRYFYQPVPGLSVSRNAAAQNAKGDIVIYLDDDAVPHPEWLLTYQNIFSAHPNCFGAGGTIRLIWENERPLWLRNEDEALYTAYDLGRIERRMSPPEFPRGANMAWRKNILLKLGGFHPDTGYDASKNALVSNEEKYMAYLVYNRGGEIWFAPSATVDHRIDQTRATPSYFLRRVYFQGVADARFSKFIFRRTAPWKILRRMIHKMAFWRATAMLRWIPESEEHPEYVLYRAKEEYNRGYLSELN